MQLVNISKSEDTYHIKALHQVKIFGITLFSKTRSYYLSETKNDWFDSSSQKAASAKEKLRLNKWLKDHQKFIEKY